MFRMHNFQFPILSDVAEVKRGLYQFGTDSTSFAVFFSLSPLQTWRAHPSSFWEQSCTRPSDSCCLHQSKCFAARCLFSGLLERGNTSQSLNPLEAAQVSTVILSCTSSREKEKKRTTPPFFFSALRSKSQTSCSSVQVVVFAPALSHPKTTI